jgi:protein involved in polysaccharide export with SLBB domain
MNNDVIFIPSRFSDIEISGAVRKPAVFELKPTEGLNQIISFSGGLLATASLKDIAIERITPFSERNTNQSYDKTITSVNLSDLYRNTESYALFDGDKVVVKSILEKVLNKVNISGSVKRPGDYPISKYSDLRSLITIAADSLLPKTYMNKLDLFSIDEDGSTHFKTFNLREILSGEVTVSLQNDDRVVIYNMMDLQDEEIIKITGFVREPKTMIWSENLSLYDVLFSSSNFEELEYKSKILASRVDIKRFNTQTGKFSIQTYDLTEILNDKKRVLLLPKDEVVVYSKDVSVVLDELIKISGFVKEPGEYTLLENMTVEDVILQAGGFLEFADKSIVTVSRPTFDVYSGKLSESYPITVNTDYLTGLSGKENSEPFYLKHNDVVNVRMIEGYEVRKSIKVSGEVVSPGTVMLENKYQTLDEILAMSGGLTPFGSLGSSYILRDGKSFIIDLRDNQNKNISFLIDDDEIVIGSKNGTVEVLGAVMNEGLFVWEEGKRLSDYIKESGDTSGKIENIVVKGPNGITKKKKWLSSPKVLPNSTIYVYPKPIKEKGDGKALDGFLKVLTVITGALTSIILVQAL